MYHLLIHGNKGEIMIHPDIIALSGFAKDTYRKEGTTFVFTDTVFDSETGTMQEHDIHISDDLLMAMYEERMAGRSVPRVVEEYVPTLEEIALGR
jgi:hypothetical protein